MSNKLKINSKGSLIPLRPARSFDKRESIITNPTTNLNSTPLFYIGPRVNTLWSSTSPSAPYALAMMKFGNPVPMHKIYGNLYNTTGNTFPNNYPNLNLTLDYKGNYKLVNSDGKAYKVHYDNNGAYVKYNKKPLYL